LAEKCLFGPIFGGLGDFDLLKLWYRCYNLQRNATVAETRVLRYHSRAR